MAFFGDGVVMAMAMTVDDGGLVTVLDIAIHNQLLFPLILVHHIHKYGTNT